MQAKKTRERVQDAIERHLGPVNSSTLRDLAERSGLSYTTLARYLLYDPPTIQLPRPSTFEKISRVLKLNPAWLRDGVGDEQLRIWPLVIHTKLDPQSNDPIAELRRAADALHDIPPHTRLRAARAAVAAAVEQIVQSFGPVPAHLYESLLQLDAMHRHHSSTEAKEA